MDLLHTDLWEMELPTETSLDYEKWLPEWKKQLSLAPVTPTVPAVAQTISTPLDLSVWCYFLRGYPDRDLVHFFLQGLSEGFRIGFNYQHTVLKSARKNLACAISHPSVVDEYLQAEVKLSRVAGPLASSSLPEIHYSRFGVIPKNHQPNKWRLIVDLSHPRNHSVDDGIPKDLCSIRYITIEDAINDIIILGKGTMLAKVDIKSAFRLLPVHPTDRHLLGMQWQNNTFIDLCLPFGLRCAPKLFNILADLFTWILKQQGVQIVHHYLDDFLTLGPPATNICRANLESITHICQLLGVPLAIEKVEGPSTQLTFLGITLDTVHMEARLPADKIARIKQMTTSWLTKKNATKREILSLIGLLQHATKIVKCGRTFVSRMYATASKVKEIDFYTRLNKDFRSDLCWWHIFVDTWNGLSLLRCISSPLIPDIYIQTDASGSWGCGSFFRGKWLQWKWPDEWSCSNIMAKEMVPIVLSCAVWGSELAKHSVCVQCDNFSVVAAIKKGAARDNIVEVPLVFCSPL